MDCVTIMALLKLWRLHIAFLQGTGEGEGNSSAGGSSAGRRGEEAQQWRWVLGSPPPQTCCPPPPTMRCPTPHWHVPYSFTHPTPEEHGEVQQRRWVLEFLLVREVEVGDVQEPELGAADRTLHLLTRNCLPALPVEKYGESVEEVWDRRCVECAKSTFEMSRNQNLEPRLVPCTCLRSLARLACGVWGQVWGEACRRSSVQREVSKDQNLRPRIAPCIWLNAFACPPLPLPACHPATTPSHRAPHPFTITARLTGRCTAPLTPLPA